MRRNVSEMTGFFNRSEAWVRQLLQYCGVQVREDGSFDARAAGQALEVRVQRSGTAPVVPRSLPAELHGDPNEIRLLANTNVRIWADQPSACVQCAQPAVVLGAGMERCWNDHTSFKGRLRSLSRAGMYFVGWRCRRCGHLHRYDLRSGRTWH